MRARVLGWALLLLFVHSTTARAEVAACLDSDPAKWPANAKPYVLFVLDTSSSMATVLPSGSNSCGFENTRNGMMRCALQRTVQAYAGVVSFGFVTFAERLASCTNGACGSCAGVSCFPGCTAQLAPSDDQSCGPLVQEPVLKTLVHAGGYVIQPVTQDQFWVAPPNAPNTSLLLGLVDNFCSSGSDSEIGAVGNSPIGGALLAVNDYLSGQYINRFTQTGLSSPLGAIAAGELACRPLQVILLSDGADNCDAAVNPTPITGGCYDGSAYPNNAGERLAAYEADRMFTTGVTTGGATYKVNTYVVGLPGSTQAAMDAIAYCGGTNASYVATSDTTLAQTLTSIISSKVTAEKGDNADNNCNGCTDEGLPHFCNAPSGLGTCCVWSIPAQRTSCGAAACACCKWTNSSERAVCSSNYAASITAQNPQGDLGMLPCTTAAQGIDPTTWLTINPGDACDGVDNNCDGSTDEGQRKCGNPAHCPVAETCNGQDDNCDGVIDEGCPGLCTPTPEVCDGCDNDCNGVADDGAAAAVVPCGSGSCAGVRTCKAPQSVPAGGCVQNGGWSACTNTPATEACDGVDNDCNGLVDDVSTTPCEPAGTPAGLVYTGTSQCQRGVQSCGTCFDFVGPEKEVCDGLDNDCNGQADDNLAASASGSACCRFGTLCGVGACTSGSWACDGVSSECQGGTGPSIETCNGTDDDCNGMVDDLPDSGSSCVTSASCAGTRVCSGASLQCVPVTSVELCNGIDDDCDGTIDEATDIASHDTRVGVPCNVPAAPHDRGNCVAGTSACSAGNVVCNGSIVPQPEQCDGIDNDCNGEADPLDVCACADAGSGGAGSSGSAGASATQDAGTPPGADAGSTGNGHAGTSGSAGEGSNARADAGDELKDASTSGGGSSDDTKHKKKDSSCSVAGVGSGSSGAGVFLPLLLVLAWRARRRTARGALALLGFLAIGCGDHPAATHVAATTQPLVCTTTGCSANQQTDPNNCGACGHVCALTNATAQCVAGVCAIASCDSGKADLDHDATNGCEGSCTSTGNEVCDTIDNDCDGKTDEGFDLASDAHCGSCGVSCLGLTHATASCVVRLGTPLCTITACTAGSADLDKVASNGCEQTCTPTGRELCNQLDDDCNGKADDGFDLDNDPRNCGSCGHSCAKNGFAHARFACRTGHCEFVGCEPGFVDPSGLQQCIVACGKPAANELCNGLDDDCDGSVDETVVAPSPSEVCGVSPQATAPECTSGVQLKCQNGQWQCTFPAKVCDKGGCAATPEICDTLDNDCNGYLNENVPQYGQPCASDDSAPGSQGACRTTGTYACASDTTVTCNAVKANCSTLSGGCAELCDGIDNDCDGLVDEPFSSKGQNATYFVKPAVTQIATSTWMYSFEATRPHASATSQGAGNGYSCNSSPCPGGAAAAPTGAPLDKTVACSVAGNLPWTGVTAAEAEQTCSLVGGHLCSTSDWRIGCTTSPASAKTCSFGYGPYTPSSACTTASTGTKFCNLGSTFDANASTPGVQHALLPTASGSLANCYADWSGLLTNGSSNDKIYDITGNARELTRTASTPVTYPVVGGSYLSDSESSGACAFTGALFDVQQTAQDVGFRCCFSADPTL